MSLTFENRVAVITGAGGGLGRSYAILLSSLGAKIVVNDLGGSLAGDKDGSKRAADAVVAEICKNGGQAVANYDSVEFGEKIVSTAIEKFGRIDILINNAGILRDKSFSKMTISDWDLVTLVHLKGAYSCTKAAWPFMQKQQYGRILFTSSAAGLYGSFGQTNYSAAKLALVGLAKSLAAEGSNKNVLSNVIVPLAGTRMTETILSKEIVEALKPEYISPVVAYLCHEKCADNGEVFECGAGWIAKVRWQRSSGVWLNKGFSIDDVKQSWAKVADFNDGVSYPSNIKDSLEMVTRVFGQAERSSEEVTEEPVPCQEESMSHKLFMLMKAYLNHGGGAEGANIVKKIGAKFFWDISEKKGGPVLKSWTVDLKSGSGNIEAGKLGQADATFTMNEEDFVKVCLGQLNPQIAFVQGKMKIRGNMRAATKFTPSVFPKIARELLNLPVKDAVNQYLRVREGVSSKSIEGQKASIEESKGLNDIFRNTGLQSESILNRIAQFLSTPAAIPLCKKVNAIYRFDILPSKNKDPISFVINLKGPVPSINKSKEIERSKVDASFTMLDSDFASLVRGKLNPQVAFMHGKMKIKGSMHAAMKFTPDLFPQTASL